MQFRGNVYKAGKVYIVGVTGDIQHTTTTGGFSSWSGYFNVPDKLDPPPGDDYELSLDDGRLGAMSVIVVRSGSHRRMVAEFKINGGLQ
jgi:hypothetical protein